MNDAEETASGQRSSTESHWMTQSHWILTGLEFRVMMEQLGRDRLPFPLQFRPAADTTADYHRQRHEAGVHIAAMTNENLRIAAHALLDPVHRIEIVGHIRPPNAADGAADIKVRAHAAVRAGSAVVLIQQPGSDDTTGGSVSMQLVDAHRAAPVALGALPVVGRGTETRVEIPRRTQSGTSTRDAGLFQRATGSTAQENFDRLLGRPRTSAGEILVCPGSATDSRVEGVVAGLHWIDNAGDGRYLVRTGSIVSVAPVSVDELAIEIGRLAAQITSG